MSCDPCFFPLVFIFLKTRATHRINIAYRCCLFGDSASHSMWLSNLIIWLTFSVVVLRYFPEAIPSKAWQLLLLLPFLLMLLIHMDTANKLIRALNDLKSLFTSEIWPVYITHNGFTKITSVKHLYKYILILELTTTNRRRWWICYRVGCGSQCNVMPLNLFYCDGQFRTNVSLSRHFVPFHFFVSFFSSLVIVVSWLGCCFFFFAHIQSLSDCKCQSMNTNYAFWYVYFWITHSGDFAFFLSLFLNFLFVLFDLSLRSSSSCSLCNWLLIYFRMCQNTGPLIKAEPHQHRNRNKIFQQMFIIKFDIFYRLSHLRMCLCMNVRKMGRAHRFPLSRHSASLRPASDTLSTCYSTHTHTLHCHTASLSRPFLRPRLSYYWHARSRNTNYVITTPTTTTKTATRTTTTVKAAQFSVTASNRKCDKNDAISIPFVFLFTTTVESIRFEESNA